MPPTRATTVEGMGQRLGIGWNVISISIVGTLGRVLGDESLWATYDGSICLPYKLLLSLMVQPYLEGVEIKLA